MGKIFSPDLDEGNGYGSFTRPISHIHKFYLSGEVKSPEEYRAWFEEIRSAPENDVIYIHINSAGGDAFTAIQFLRALYETKAITVASVEGMCMSAATLIFMGAQNHEITNHSMFMFHNFSTVAAGKGGELYAHAVNAKSWSEELLNDIYDAFLTKPEISSILRGEDLYLTGEEVNKRLHTRKKKLRSLQKKMIRETKVVETAKKAPRKAVKSKMATT